MNFAVRMGLDPTEQIREIIKRIDFVLLAGADQGKDCSCPDRPTFTSSEEPVVAANRDVPHLLLNANIAQLQLTMCEEQLKC